jgi:hypothetical protein
MPPATPSNRRFVVGALPPSPALPRKMGIRTGHLEGHSRAEVLGRVLDEELPRYAEALERLGQ